MNATFFALALVSALSPKLLGVDLLLINNRRRNVMFACCLLGGMGVALLVGLLDVLVLHADAIGTQDLISAGLDVGLGVVLVAVGALIATGHLRRSSTRVGSRRHSNKDGWARRLLTTPRPGGVVLIGVVCGIPGAKYLAALHTLVTGESSTATQVVAVVVFVLLEFSLMIIPFVYLMFRPNSTGEWVRGTQSWFMGHARQFIAVVLLCVGVYMVITGLVRLIG